MPEKPHLNMVIVGHVDHGKSTLFGRVLVETGAVKPEEVEKLKEIAAEYGKEGWEFAYLLDKEKEERMRGLTIDVAHRPFETQKYFFTVIDAPGHRDFVRNMITGASQADCALLVVSAKPGEGVQEQTKEHVFLLKVLGINQVVVAINKMDTCNFDQKRYEEVKQQVIDLMKPLGFPVDKIPFIPVSAKTGDNITKLSEKTPWYKGPTLLEAFDQTFQIPPRPVDKPLRIPIQDVYSITGVGLSLIHI